MKRSNNFITAIILMLGVILLFSVLSGGAVGSNPGSGVGGSNDDIGTNEGGGSTSTCTHATTTTVIENTNNAVTHVAVIKCSLCGKTQSSASQEHKFYMGVCSDCNYICKHPEGSYTIYKENGYSGHTKASGCLICTHVTETSEQHAYLNGICSNCNFECTHTETHVSYAPYNNLEHSITRKCGHCSQSQGVTTSLHEMKDGICIQCGYGCSHPEIHVSYAPYNNLEHSITRKCEHCSQLIEVSTTLHHMKDGICIQCGYGCSHPEMRLFYDPSDNDLHCVRNQCLHCWYWRETYYEAHDYSEDGICRVCSYNHSCVFDLNSKCTMCGKECLHMNAGLERNGLYRKENGRAFCLVCDHEFNSCTVDGMILAVWDDEQAYTWFAFDLDFGFTVDGEVVSHGSGLVVCNPDGTPVNMRDWLEDGVAYVRKPLEHGELINYKDPSTCNHEDEEGNWSMVKCNKYDNLRRCMFCGHQAVG